MQTIRNNSINLFVLVLLLIFAVGGLLFSMFAHIQASDVNWWQWADGAFQNFSTEVIGAILTFALFGLADRTKSISNQKQTLIRNAGSRVNDVAKQAIEELRAHDWLTGDDGLLKGANLTQANLTGANLEDANLTGANLRYANLEEAHLYNVNLERADLVNANLKGANLISGNLEGAYLGFAILTGAHLARVNLEGALLGSANLEEAHLEGAYLDGAELRNVNLEGAHLQSNTLPDSFSWGYNTDWERFTNTDHPEFPATLEKINTIRAKKGLDPIV